MKRKTTYFAGLPHTEALVRLVHERFYSPAVEAAIREFERGMDMLRKAGVKVPPEPHGTPETAASEAISLCLGKVMAELSQLTCEGTVTKEAVEEILKKHTFALTGALKKGGAFEGLAKGETGHAGSAPRQLSQPCFSPPLRGRAGWRAGSQQPDWRAP